MNESGYQMKGAGYASDQHAYAPGAGLSGGEKTRRPEIGRYADDLEKMLAACAQVAETMEAALGGVVRSDPPTGTNAACMPEEVPQTAVGERLRSFVRMATGTHDRMQSLLRRLEV